MDTCANESFNNTISWLAPKNKVYCGIHSLNNHISIVIGITTPGTFKYFEELFQKLGIELTPDVVHFLTIKSTHRKKRIDKAKTTEFLPRGKIRPL